MIIGIALIVAAIVIPFIFYCIGFIAAAKKYKKILREVYDKIQEFELEEENKPKESFQDKVNKILEDKKNKNK